MISKSFAAVQPDVFAMERDAQQAGLSELPAIGRIIPEKWKADEVA